MAVWLSPQMNVFKTGNFQWTDHSDEFTRLWPWLGIIIANNVRGVNMSTTVSRLISIVFIRLNNCYKVYLIQVECLIIFVLRCPPDC